jgi:hypothetical protein
MSREDENKEVVGRWFTKFWGETCDLRVVDDSPRRICFFSTRCTSHVGDGKTSRRS